MGIAHLFNIRHKSVGKRAVRVEITVVILFPGARVYLVDIYGRLIDVFAVSALHPLFVVPLVAIVDFIVFCSRTGARFHMKAVWVALHKRSSVGSGYTIFIHIVGLDILDFSLPNAAAVFERLHRIFSLRPIVKISRNADIFCVRRPNSENHGILIFSVGAEILIRI